MDLTMLTPGVTEADDQCAINCTGTNFVSNGSRNSTADVLMDGATISNPWPGVTQVTYTPSPEAVEEFRVEQSNFSAEYGFSGASVVNMITRSGSNTFHGSVYDFVRNKIADSNGWFANLDGDPLPSVHRHNFGGTVSGPIFKNKTFFFADYDGTRQSSASTPQAGVPPTPSATTATLARYAHTMAEPSIQPACAVSPRGRFGIPIPACTKPAVKMAAPREHTGKHTSPTITSAHTPARAIQN